MRRAPVVMLLLLAMPPVLAGCISGSDGAPPTHEARVSIGRFETCVHLTGVADHTVIRPGEMATVTFRLENCGTEALGVHGDHPCDGVSGLHASLLRGGEAWAILQDGTAASERPPCDREGDPTPRILRHLAHIDAIATWNGTFAKGACDGEPLAPAPPGRYEIEARALNKDGAPRAVARVPVEVLPPLEGTESPGCSSEL